MDETAIAAAVNKERVWRGIVSEVLLLRAVFPPSPVVPRRRHQKVAYSYGQRVCRSMLLREYLCRKAWPLQTEGGRPREQAGASTVELVVLVVGNIASRFCFLWSVCIWGILFVFLVMDA